MWIPEGSRHHPTLRKPLNTVEVDPSKLKIHLLVEGRCLCREFDGHPDTWSDGHVYVRLEGDVDVAGVVNCGACLAALKRGRGRERS